MNSRHKIALGGGGFCLYAPRFPKFQRYPGFADEVLISNVNLPRLYMLAVLEGGVLLDFRCTKFEVKNGELLFCAHHGKKHQEKLSQIAHSWHDETARLFEEQRA